VLAAGCRREVASGQVDGAAVFAVACARCHGPRGVPERAMVATLGVKDLSAPELHVRLSDEAIRRQILEGSKNHQMPAFAGALSDSQIDGLVRHVRTLRRVR
jgi:mono/diheme cytochrome c family protein